MFCPNCGAQRQRGGNFCSACGISLAGATSPPSPSRPRTVLNRVFLALSGFLIFAALLMLALGIRLPPQNLVTLPLWVGGFAAAYVRQRRWLWFFAGILLGLLALNLAAYVGAMYRATLPG